MIDKDFAFKSKMIWSWIKNMDLRLNDIIYMKKKHPCGKDGSECLEILRIGMDVRVKCVGCGRQMLLPREKVEKNIKKIIHKE